MLVTLLSPVLIVLVAPGVLARHVVPLHRQRVPVQGDDDRISYKSVYFGSVVVGKPEQKFSVVFDTGSGHVILPSSECHSETCLIHNRYNRQASDGAVDVDYDGTPVRSGAPRDQITVAFGTGEVTGQFVHDRICLSPEAPASQSAGTSAGSANTEPLLLVQSGDALERHRGENISAMDQSSKMDKNSTSPTQLRHEAMNCVDLRVVMATEMTEEPFHAFAFDGVLGLGLDSLALAPEFSFFGMMAKQVALEESNFGVFLADSDDEISEISFGGISHDKITSALTWAKVASPELGYWQVQVTSIRIGNRTLDYCNDGQCRAVVDTGTSLLAVPEDFAEQLQQELETALRDPTPSASGGVDCRHAAGLPLHFDVEGRSITLLPADYSRQAVHAEEFSPVNSSVQEKSTSASDLSEPMASQAKRPTCQPTIMPLELPEPLGPKLFIWGEPVLRKYYTVYDWKEKQIGFGLAAHTPPQVSADEEAKQLRGRGLLFA